MSSSGLGASCTFSLSDCTNANRVNFSPPIVSLRNKHDTEPANPMNEPDLEEDGGADVVNASEAGCEAVFVPGEDRTEDGHWHFAQKYDEGNPSFLMNLKSQERSGNVGYGHGLP